MWNCFVLLLRCHALHCIFSLALFILYRNKWYQWVNKLFFMEWTVFFFSWYKRSCGLSVINVWHGSCDSESNDCAELRTLLHVGLNFPARLIWNRSFFSSSPSLTYLNWHDSSLLSALPLHLCVLFMMWMCPLVRGNKAVRPSALCRWVSAFRLCCDLL